MHNPYLNMSDINRTVMNLIILTESCKLKLLVAM